MAMVGGRDMAGFGAAAGCAYEAGVMEAPSDDMRGRDGTGGMAGMARDAVTGTADAMPAGAGPLRSGGAAMYTGAAIGRAMSAWISATRAAVRVGSRVRLRRVAIRRSTATRRCRLARNCSMSAATSCGAGYDSGSAPALLYNACASPHAARK